MIWQLLYDLVTEYKAAQARRRGLDVVLDDLFTKPCRTTVGMQDGDDPRLQWGHLGTYAGDGMRWEKDAEFRTRIIAQNKGTP